LNLNCGQSDVDHFGRKEEFTLKVGNVPLEINITSISMTWCFKKFPQGLLFHEIFEHAIKRTPCSISTNIRPYRYPYHQMREIESMAQEMLDARIIQLG
jgi:hypothetical protein